MKTSKIKTEKKLNRSLTFYLPIDLHTKLKLTAVKERKSMGEIITESLKERLTKSIN